MIVMMIIIIVIIIMILAPVHPGPHTLPGPGSRTRPELRLVELLAAASGHIVAIFCPFSQFCEIGISLLSLQKQPKTALNLFQTEVDYGKYGPARRMSSASWRSSRPPPPS